MTKLLKIMMGLCLLILASICHAQSSGSLQAIPISDGPLEVQVGFNLVNITDVNEKEETIDFDGQLPVDEIIENGFYIQTAFFPVPKKLELYAATSQIYGDSDAILTTVPNT